MAKDYFQELLDMANYYSTPCEPEVIDVWYEYEGEDNDGNVETSTRNIYNCENCIETNCEYWEKYN